MNNSPELHNYEAQLPEHSVWNVNSYRFISLLYRLGLTAWYSLVSDSFKSQKS